MKNLLLNCDQVFDVLTRGPFPSGDASDESVEHHLRACHECRQLAEALRPAVELLHESIDRAGAIDLPEYQGTLPVSAPAARPARPLTLGLRQISAPTPKRSDSGRSFDRTVSAVRLIAASLLVAALGILGYGFAVSGAGSSRTAGLAGLLGVGRPPAHLPDGPAILSLASLKLPARCIPARYQTLTADHAAALAAAMASGSEEALRCCTECHAAEKMRQASPELVAVVAQSCASCHRG